MPSFSIEVPGEANPLTEQLLVQTLQSAASSDPQQIQVGTKQLQEWQKTPTFYQHLQSAYLDQRLPTELRYLAIIQLKNGIDKYWRKTAQNAVSANDKQIIRSRLLEGILVEPDSRLGLQNALVIAKIARYEFPNDWPDAISGFLEGVRSPETALCLARSLLALLHIVKELSTARLIRSRTQLQAATPEIIQVVGEVYANLVDRWYESPEANLDALQHGLLAIKLIRRLLITGYEHPNRHEEVVTFWNYSIERLQNFLRLLHAGSLNPIVSSIVERHVVQLAKLHRTMATDHAATFASLPSAIDLALSYWSFIKDFGETFGPRETVIEAFANPKQDFSTHDSAEKPTIEKIALKGLLLIRACVKMVHNPAQSFKYSTPADKLEKAQATALVRQTLLTESFVREVMEIMVSRFFVFRASDLQEWVQEPEEWEKREEGDGQDWEFSIRSCSEKLFLDLAINYKDILVQPLMNVFNSVARLDNDDILLKDSVYTAIELAAPVLVDHLDFDAFLRDVLVREVQNKAPGYGIIRRRAAILVGQWISIKVAEDTRPLVYQIFEHLLNPNDPLNDQVVRVTSGRQFLNVVNSWDFKPEQFIPYVSNVVSRLLQLIATSELIETKMAILNTISATVERLESHIVPFAEQIVVLLPDLWEESGEEHIMKQSILGIFTRLVNAMKAASLPLQDMVIPIIKGALEPGSETQVYLLEDALELWGALLIQSETATDGLVDLVPYLFPLYEFASENLNKALELTESYILLAPATILTDSIRANLIHALGSIIGVANAEASGQACNVLESVIRIAHSLGGEQGVRQISIDLARAGILSRIVEGLHGSWVAHSATGPRAKAPPVDGVLETDYFAILARLSMGSLHAFTPDREMAIWICEEWFLKIEGVGDPSRRKLLCLAITKYLSLGQSWPLSNLQSYMSMWVDLVTELREDEADKHSDSLIHNEPSEDKFGEETPEDTRRRALTSTDDVRTIPIPAWIKQHLQQGIAQAGGEQRFQQEWLSNVDTDVVRSFSELGLI